MLRPPHALLLSLVLALGCEPVEPAPNSVSRDVSFESADRVEVRLDAGSVSVVVAEQPTALATVSWRGAVTPLLDMRLVDGTVVVDLDCPAEALDCAAELQLAVPAEARLDIETGAGDVEIAGTSGAVAVDVGTGEVTLVDLTGAVDVSVATGSVIGVDLDVPAARIWVGEGDVDLQLLAPVAELDVAVDQGGVRLSGG